MSERPVADVTVTYEAGDAVETTTIEDATYSYVDDGMFRIERKAADRSLEWEKSFNQEKLVSTEHEWRTEVVERPDVERSLGVVNKVLILAIGLLFGSMITMALAGCTGQVSL